MKIRTCFILLFSLFAFYPVFSQELEMDTLVALQSRSRIIETTESMVNGTQSALMVVLEITDKKLADKVWKNFMKDYRGKTKRVKGGKENLTVVDIVGINGVSPINVYSRSETGMDGYVEMIVWFDLGDEFLSYNRRAQYEEAEKMLLKYALECKVENTSNELKDAEKKLKSLENEMDKLTRLNMNYHRDIEDAERKIEEAKQNIVKNEELQGDTTQKIELQKELVEEINRRLSGLRGN